MVKNGRHGEEWTNARKLHSIPSTGFEIKNQ
jgi:hypothetical protein